MVKAMLESIKICFLAVMTIILALPLRHEKTDYSLLIGLALGIGILCVILHRMQSVMTAFEQLKSYLGAGGGYLGILLKVLGITYVCEFASSICKEAGYGFVAGQLEVLGKMSVMVSGISFLFALIEQLHALA